jgi:hypothetical protein
VYKCWSNTISSNSGSSSSNSSSSNNSNECEQYCPGSLLGQVLFSAVAAHSKHSIKILQKLLIVRLLLLLLPRRFWHTGDAATAFTTM